MLYCMAVKLKGFFVKLGRDLILNHQVLQIVIDISMNKLIGIQYENFNLLLQFELQKHLFEIGQRRSKWSIYIFFLSRVILLFSVVSKKITNGTLDGHWKVATII